MAASAEAGDVLLARTAGSVRACVRCRLHLTRTQAVPGEGPARAGVLIIGEAPGRDEDLSGRPFVGRAGRILDRALEAARLRREDVFITNLVKCRPPGNRTPRTDEIASCQPYLLAQVEALGPKVIVTLGSTALRGLLGPNAELKAVRGTPADFHGTRVVATYHPAAVLYNRNLERSLVRDLRQVRRHVQTRSDRVRSGPPRPGKDTRPASSSGGVVHDARGHVLLLKRADEEIWCLPKGAVEPGEALQGTAVREIEEETGLRVRLMGPVHAVSYEYYWPPDDVNYAKTVTYYLAEPVSGSVRLEAGFDDSRWATRSQALRLLRWQNDRDVVTKAFELLRTGAVSGGMPGPSRAATRSRRRRP